MDRFARTLSLSASSMMRLTAGADGEGSTPGPTANNSQRATPGQRPTANGRHRASGQRATSQDVVAGNAAETWHLPETAKGQHSASGLDAPSFVSLASKAVRRQGPKRQSGRHQVGKRHAWRHQVRKHYAPKRQACDSKLRNIELRASKRVGGALSFELPL